MSRIAGIAYLAVDGAQYPLRGDFTVSPSSVEREMLAGQDGVHGHREMPRVPFIAGNVSLPPEVSVEALERMRNVTVTAELANGKTYVLREAMTTSAFEIDTAEGQVTVRWEGHRCDEF